MSEQGRLPESSMKATIGDLAWQNLTRYSETLPPQSIAVEVKYGGYVYRGTAYLTEEKSVYRDANTKDGEG